MVLTCFAQLINFKRLAPFFDGAIQVGCLLKTIACICTLSLSLSVYAEDKGCVDGLKVLYIPLASAAFMEPLFVDLQEAINRLTGCEMHSEVALDYRDFIERLSRESFHLVLAPAHSVQAIAHRLEYRPLVATERLFAARLISHRPLNEKELVSALVGQKIYTPDVLSAVFMALEQWLARQGVRYRVNLEPGHSHDKLIKDVASKEITFAAVADAFITDSVQSGVHTVVYLPLPLGPLYLLHNNKMDKDLVEYLKSAMLEYNSLALKAFLKTEKLFVPASVYPSSFFVDDKRRFIELMMPGFLSGSQQERQ